MKNKKGQPLSGLLEELIHFLTEWYCSVCGLFSALFETPCPLNNPTEYSHKAGLSVGKIRRIFGTPLNLKLHQFWFRMTNFAFHITVVQLQILITKRIFK
jgi:hypothetical protein